MRDEVRLRLASLILPPNFCGWGTRLRFRVFLAVFLPILRSVSCSAFAYMMSIPGFLVLINHIVWRLVFVSDIVNTICFLWQEYGWVIYELVGILLQVLLWLYLLYGYGLTCILIIGVFSVFWYGYDCYIALPMILLSLVAVFIFTENNLIIVAGYEQFWQESLFFM